MEAPEINVKKNMSTYDTIYSYSTKTFQSFSIYK